MEIELYNKLSDPIAAIDRVGEWIAKSGLFGCDRPEQGKILAMICMCERKSPTELTRTYDIVEGKLKKKALAALAEFRQRGGKHQWLEAGDTPTAKEEDRRATLEVTPPDGPKIKYSYTLADARTEGLIRDKSRWTKRPGNMLRARCITNLLGMVMPEIFAGEDDESAPVTPRGDDIGLLAPPAVSAPVPQLVAPVTEVAPEPTAEPVHPADQAAAAPAAPTLSENVVAQLEGAIGDHATAAGQWFVKQGWLQPGQDISHLTPARARRILANSASFIAAINK